MIARLVPLLQFLMCISYPIAKPLACILDGDAPRTYSDLLTLYGDAYLTLSHTVHTDPLSLVGLCRAVLLVIVLSTYRLDGITIRAVCCICCAL